MWSFLDDRFVTLKGLLHVERANTNTDVNPDAIRLGREDEELWIDVRLPTDEATADRCHVFHEALVLTSLVAVVDYDAWRDALVAISEVSVPADVDLHAASRPLQPRFRLLLYGGEHERTPFAEHVIVVDQPSDRFMDQYHEIAKKASGLGVQIDHDTTFPVRVLVGCPYRTALPEQVEVVRRATAAIRSLQDRAEQPHTYAGLRLDSVVMQMQNGFVHSTMFYAMLELVETGVRVASLHTPSRMEDYDRADGPALRNAWSLLACAVCGRSQRPTERPIVVERLEVDGVFSHPMLLRPLLTVLNQARALACVTFPVCSPHTDPRGFMWLWIGHALFRADSQCSVDALGMELTSLSTVAITKLREAIESFDSLKLIWRLTTQTENDASGNEGCPRQAVVLPAGTSVRPFGTIPGTHLNTLELSNDWSGVIVDDDASKTTIDVLLYGIGFCEVQRSTVPNKRPRLIVSRHEAADKNADDSVHRIRSLSLRVLGSDFGGDDEEDEGQGAERTIDALFDGIGQELTALSLSDLSVNDNIIGSCLEKCPGLQSLHLEGCQLSSMGAIIESYERGGQISSLDLSAIEVDQTFLKKFEEDFLSALLVPSKLKNTLKKLRIGHQWAIIFRQSTANVMKQVLNDTRTLDYLHLYRCENPRIAPSIEWDIASHHNEIIAAPGLPTVDVRVAFASVVKHLRTRNKFAGLHSEIVAPVLEYVGQNKKRVVISEVNTYYNSRIFGGGR